MIDAQDEHRSSESRSFEHLIGLRLTEARRSLQEDSSCASWPLQIIETAPPQAPQRSPRAMPRKARNEAMDRPARAEKQFGEWRVLRCVVQKPDVSHNLPGLQLIVAREELRPLAVEPVIENTTVENAPFVEKASSEASLNL
jgi:hypothetical protein